MLYSNISNDNPLWHGYMKRMLCLGAKYAKNHPMEQINFGNISKILP